MVRSPCEYLRKNYCGCIKNFVFLSLHQTIFGLMENDKNHECFALHSINAIYKYMHMYGTAHV